MQNKHGELHTQVCNVLFDNQIDIYNVDQQNIKKILGFYDAYLSYLAELATAHDFLTQNQITKYAITINFYLSKFQEMVVVQIDIIDKFSINCLYSLLKYILAHPPNPINPNQNQVAFFDVLLMLANYFSYMKKNNLKESIYYKLFSNLLLQLVKHFEANEYWVGLIRHLHGFAMGFESHHTKDMSFQNYFKSVLNSINQMTQKMCQKYLIKANMEMHLLSRQKMIYEEIYQRYFSSKVNFKQGKIIQSSEQAGVVLLW